MKRVFITTSCLLFLACNSNKNQFQEIRDDNLTVQVMKMDNGQDKSEMTYQVRLLPDKNIKEKLTDEKKNDIWYRMDSCFYIQTGSIKIAANLVQPIANGQNQNYEFMLTFSADTAITDSSTLVYKDSYLNKKTYNFKVNL